MRGQQIRQAAVDEVNDVVRCAYDDGKVGRHILKVEGQGKLVVCTPHRKQLENQNKDVRCQYCGVPVRNDWRKSALRGFEHVPNCPRSDKVVLELG